MYVRIARFEGAEGNWDERIEEVRKRMRSTGEDSPMPAGVVKRALMLVDRENSRGASVLFCETEEKLRRADEAMNAMNRPGGGGTRTGVEMYEVAVDEQPA
ncbi:MAG: hypothetical protein NVSMB51_12100 [Solirubrobacteraceae bacterium]